MASSKIISDLAASNQLQISITTITNGQKWMRQIRGVYSLLYPWMIGDFVHLKDFKQWLKLYEKHIHGNGNNGSPTTKPIIPAIYTTALAYSLVIPNEAVGKLRTGFAEAVLTATELQVFNLKPLGQ